MYSLLGCRSGDTAGSAVPVNASEMAGYRAPRVPGYIDLWAATDQLIEAIVELESGRNPQCIGLDGERGLMQIMEHTWSDITADLYGRPLHFDMAFQPDLNRKIGRSYLHQLQRYLGQYRDCWQADERSLLLACYNAGPDRVRQAGFTVSRLPESTQRYIERATALHDDFLNEKAEAMQYLLERSL